MPETGTPETVASAAIARLKHVGATGQRLADSIAEWQALDPIKGVVQIADDRFSWEVCWSIAPPALDSWGLMFGDAVHNLRSILDNLAYRIAEGEGADPKDLKNVQFPIASTEEDWRKASRRVSMLPSRVQRAIESVQPFQRPEIERTSDLLALLSWFNNADKHRVAIADSVEPREISHEFRVEFEDDSTAEGPPRTEIGAVIRDGAIAIRHETAPDRIKHVSGSVRAEAQVVVFDEWGVQHGITAVLAALATYVPLVAEVVLDAWSAPGGAGAPEARS